MKAKMPSPCPTCCYEFSYRSGLTKHLRIGCKGVRRHKPGDPYKCDDCKREFTTKESLSRHRQTACRGFPLVAGWRCVICKTTFSCRQNLHRHKKETEKQQYESLIKEATEEASTLPNTSYKDLNSAIEAFERIVEPLPETNKNRGIEECYLDDDNEAVAVIIDNAGDSDQGEDDYDNWVEPIIPTIITADMEDVIRHAKSLHDEEVINNQAIRNHAPLREIRRAALRKLLTGKWLDDSIIYGYLQLIQQRADNHKSLPKVFVFDTCMYPRLIQGKHWGEKDKKFRPKFFDKDILLVPIHLPSHWCLAAIFVKEREIRYYDSLGGRNQLCFRTLLKFIRDEIKKQQVAGNFVEDDMSNLESWKIRYPFCPQQENGFDCGMFLCKCAEYLSRNAALIYRQDDMPYYRYRMQYELITGQIFAP